MMADYIRPTPRNPFLGGLADLLEASTSPERTQQMQGIMSMLNVPAVASTLNRMSYGAPLTSGAGGLGGTTRILPDVLEAAMTVAPMAGATAKVAGKGAMMAGRAGERMAERVVPQIMERGGLPAELLQGMAQGTQRKIFIGPTSPVFNKEAAFQASKLMRKGESPQQIWRQTGTGQGPDKQWRQELSDDLSKYDPDALKELKESTDFDYLTNTQPLGGVIEHKELYKAYPELSDMPVRFMPSNKMQGAFASYSPKNNRMTLSDTLDPEKARSSALHESQHAIQEIEDFAVGGNARDFVTMKNKAFEKISELNNQMSDIAKKLDNKSLSKSEEASLRSQYDEAMLNRQSLIPTASIDPVRAYANLMGEAEARLTQRRINLTPEQRLQNFPFEYTGQTGYGLDVPVQDLINMTTNGTILNRGLLGTIAP